MQRFFEDFLNRLELEHKTLEATVEGLPLEAIDWSPGPEMNSLGVLAIHVAGSEKHWLGDILAGEPSGRDREAEFRSRGLEVPILKERLEGSLEYARRVVGRLTLDDLSDKREAGKARGERTMTVAAILLHVLRHAAEHAGHMQLTRQLWEVRAAGR